MNSRKFDLLSNDHSTSSIVQVLPAVERCSQIEENVFTANQAHYFVPQESVSKRIDGDDLRRRYSGAKGPPESSGFWRFAARLFSKHLSQDFRYVGVDLSSTMVRLATERLQPWAARAEVRQSDGSADFPEPDGAFDRFVATYVLDLLSPDEIRSVVACAHRLLLPGDRLCLVSLTYGETLLGRLVASIWEWVFAWSPQRVGGCRPIRLREYLSISRWRLAHRRVVSSFGISSEVVVAIRI